MHIEVINQKNQTRQVALPPLLDEVVIQPALLHQVVVAQAANRRRPIAQTKSRGVVRGGGRKPWRQKGTGRARHSSIRSPLWVGGGITFGPTSARNFSLALPKMIRRQAFKMAIVQTIKDQKYRVLENWEGLARKTAAIHRRLQDLPNIGKSVLLLMNTFEPSLILASQNLAYVTLATVDSVRLSDLLSVDTIVLDSATFNHLVERTFDQSVQFAGSSGQRETVLDKKTV